MLRLLLLALILYVGPGLNAFSIQAKSTGSAPSPSRQRAGVRKATRLANNFPGIDLGAKINAADKDLGSAPGEIRVQDGGTISTQVIISPEHTLRFGPGTYKLTTELMWEGAFLLKSRTSVMGSGWDTVIVEPSRTGWIVFQSHADARTPPTNSGTDSNISIANLQIKGANPAVDGGVRQTVQLGNCHHCRVEHVWLNGTGVIGVQAGGNSSTGNFAEAVTIKNNLFTQVASQAAAVVNGRDVTIDGNTFKDSGRKGVQHATAIDIEPNTSSDIAQRVEITNNLIDSRGSGFLHGNGILVQNGARTRDFGPVLIKGNTVIGGNLEPDVGGNIGNGIFVVYYTEDVTVIDNTIQRVLYSGIRLQNTTRNYVARNKLVSTGAGDLLSRGLSAWRAGLSVMGLKQAIRTMIGDNVSFEIIDTTESKIFDNVVAIDPNSPAATSLIQETGTSRNNLYRGNTDGRKIPAPTVYGQRSVTGP